MKNIYLLAFGFVLTFLLVPENTNGNPNVIEKWKVPNSKAESLFDNVLPKFDEVISPFDACFLLWDGYLSSVKGCVRSALGRQTDQLRDSGFEDEELAKLSDYWRDLCTTLHPDAHELSQLGFLECYYNGRDSWELEN
jgi:hypothetical protein